MTAEEKLDVALRFLAQENRGSYLYPEVIDFEKHLTSNGIDEKEHLPIILHLVRNHYVDAFYALYPGDEREGKAPRQIKITFKGIKFLEKGGYVQLVKSEREGKSLLELSIEDLKKKDKQLYWVTGITLIGTIGGTLLGAWLGSSDIPDPINVKVTPPSVVYDTTVVHDTIYINSPIDTTAKQP
ncbi:MAG: hypothetical protein L6Q81_07465 [Bacteroidia bacterium]|nr:hypothetical protein [Bacteroidia bacterium]